MYCPNCGCQCSDDSVFCSTCGKKIKNNISNVGNANNNEYSDKSKIAAGILQIFLPFGIGRFYTGHSNIGAAQLIVSIVTCGFGSIWSFIDGIIILCTNDFKDSDGKIMK